MSHAAKSLFVFGMYLCALVLLLLLVPNLILPLFGAPPTNEVWIRMNGMFVLCLSFYYVAAARHGLTGFIRWTVWARGGHHLLYCFRAAGRGPESVAPFRVD